MFTYTTILSTVLAFSALASVQADSIVNITVPTAVNLILSSDSIGVQFSWDLKLDNARGSENNSVELMAGTSEAGGNDVVDIISDSRRPEVISEYESSARARSRRVGLNPNADCIGMVCRKYVHFIEHGKYN